MFGHALAWWTLGSQVGSLTVLGMTAVFIGSTPGSHAEKREELERALNGG